MGFFLSYCSSENSNFFSNSKHYNACSETSHFLFPFWLMFLYLLDRKPMKSEYEGRLQIQWIVQRKWMANNLSFFSVRYRALKDKQINGNMISSPTLHSETHCQRALWKINIDMHYKKGKKTLWIACPLLAIQKNSVPAISPVCQKLLGQSKAALLVLLIYFPMHPLLTTSRYKFLEICMYNLLLFSLENRR